MRCAVVGSRTFSDYGLLSDALDEAQRGGEVITEIISGGARGADTLAERYAAERGIPVKIFKPDWQLYGRSAGMIRNADIVGEADRVAAFWDGESHGTGNSIQLAREQGKLWILRTF